MSEEISEKPKKTLLIAEDTELLRNMVVRTLEKAGYNLLIAKNATEAWQLFGEHRTKIDGVFFDNDMPATDDGLILAKDLRDNGFNGIIVVNSGRFPSNPISLRAISEEYGCDACIAKPYSPPFLLATLSSAFATRAKPEEQKGVSEGIVPPGDPIQYRKSINNFVGLMEGEGIKRDSDKSSWGPGGHTR